MLYAGILGGVGLARAGWSLPVVWCAAIGTLAAVSWRRHTFATLCLVMLLGVSLGWWRGSIYMRNLAVYDDWQYREVP